MAGTPIQPNFETMGGNPTLYSQAIEGSIMAARRTALAFAPHEQDPPDMTVRVDVGHIFDGTTLTEKVGQNSTAITAPSTNPRIDRVVVDRYTGVILVVAGTEAAAPTAPAIPADKLPVCQILLATSTTAITNDLITDERTLGLLGLTIPDPPAPVTAAPAITWADASTVTVAATANSPAVANMSGFPNVLNSGQLLAVNSDGISRINSSDVSAQFGSGGNYGTEKVSQWYALFALAGNADTTFTLKAMPWMRVKSQAGQVISLGTLLTPATGIGYGLTTDELVGASIYFISGASKGLLRTITANNNNDATGGTVTYSGTALTVAAGDWFIILPNTNFRYLGDVWNDGSSNIRSITQDDNEFKYTATNYTAGENVPMCSPMATSFNALFYFIGGGNSEDSGGPYPVGPKDPLNNIVAAGLTTNNFDGTNYLSVILVNGSYGTFPLYDICTVTMSLATAVTMNKMYVSGYILPL
ncbi:MAG: hypothetical protein WC356_01725 [Candidatus Micrarchaeia archaeon]|jgi:hypothetical protein